MDINSINSAKQCLIAFEAAEEEKRKQKIEEEIKIKKLNAPIIQYLQALIEQGNEQIKALQEDNEIQKRQIKKLEENEKRAKHEAKRRKIFSVISFCISTGIAIASLIVAMVK